MATPNYSYEKRQRELAKKRKTEEKRARKANPGREDGQDPALDTPADSTAVLPQPASGEPASAS